MKRAIHPVGADVVGNDVRSFLDGERRAQSVENAAPSSALPSAFSPLFSVLALALGVLCAAAFPLRAATVTGNLTDLTGAALAPRVVFTPLSTPLADGTNTVLDTPKTVAADTNGAFTLSLKGGLYSVGFGPYSKGIRVLIPPDDTNAYTLNQVAGLATNVGTFSYTNPLQVAVAAGTNVTAVTNNGLVTLSANAVAAADPTVVVAGDNVTIVTNGNRYTIAAQSGTNITYTTNNSLALSSEQLRKLNSPDVELGAPLAIPTWDGTNTLVHFNVIRTTNEIGGCYFWGTYTTFPPVAREAIEVACSEDGVFWKYPGSGLSSNRTTHAHGIPDPDIFQHTNGALAVVAPSLTAASKLQLCTSTNGYEWSALFDGPVHSGSVAGLLSPKFVRVGGDMRLYYNRTTSASVGKLWYAQSVDGSLTNWGTPVECTLGPAGGGSNIWHFELQYASNTFHLVWTTGGGPWPLYYSTSTDGVSFTNVSQLAIKSQTPWDAKRMYKVGLIPRTNYNRLLWDAYVSAGWPTADTALDPWKIVLYRGLTLPANADLYATTSTTTSTNAAQYLSENGTNYLWMDLLNYRDISTANVMTATSNYYGPTLIWTTPLYAGGTNIFYNPAPGFYSTVSTAAVRGVRSGPLRLPGFQHFRLTGYWCSTNSDTSINLWRRVATLRGGGIAEYKDVLTAFNYSSTTTNIVTDSQVISLGSPTTADGFISVEYGLNNPHGLDITLWLLGLKLEYW